MDQQELDSVLQSSEVLVHPQPSPTCCLQQHQQETSSTTKTNIHSKLPDTPRKELDQMILFSYGEVRKADSSDYDPESLLAGQASA